MKPGVFLIFLAMPFLFGQKNVEAQVQQLDTAWHHLRNADPREWADFPMAAERKLILAFSAQPNTSEHTLSFRQYDVKNNWGILLNGVAIGSLVRDEKDLIACLEIPPGSLKTENTLEISCRDIIPDDIRVGEILLHHRSMEEVLSESRLTLDVFDAGTRERIPARITIVNVKGILQSTGGLNKSNQAVRPGYIYTGGDGSAHIGVPAGTYTLYATRGFEYGVDSTNIVINAGDHQQHDFFIKREVPTTGWISSDTHIHTTTWSGHGDATAAERVLTIAGEGIELPVITDHNKGVDLKPFAVEQKVDHYFTLISGNEVTTAIGHFNVFPVSPGDVINHNAKTWAALARDIRASGNTQAIVLNHARDLHLKFRPFDSARHLSSAGMRLDKSEFFADAMEVLNSGAQQTDQRQLIRDWFGLLNHGHFISPVGSSDSHDVSRYFVGQARTYIRCNDDDPANLDTEQAITNFIAGNVMVSFGLLAEIEINDAYGPGELVPESDQVKVSVKVTGPSWARAQMVELYANGQKIREEEIENQHGAGMKWNGTWDLTLPAQDMFLVAVASGDGGRKPFWPIAKPYQPQTSEWSPYLLGLSGAVWVDADKNGIRNSAKDYAQRIYKQSGRNLEQMIRSLAAFDETVSVQAAAILYKNGKDLSGKEVSNALRSASPQTRSGFQTVINELQRLKN